MKVKEFLSVCDFMPNEVKDLSRNIYLLNGRKYEDYEEMDIRVVTNTNGYILIILDTFGN